jgi:hypothetical protein
MKEVEPEQPRPLTPMTYGDIAGRVSAYSLSDALRRASNIPGLYPPERPWWSNAIRRARWWIVDDLERLALALARLIEWVEPK